MAYKAPDKMNNDDRHSDDEDKNRNDDEEDDANEEEGEEDGEDDEGEDDEDDEVEDDEDWRRDRVVEPWRAAVESGEVQQVQDLIHQRGYDILQENHQTTAFLVAVQMNHMAVVKYLLEDCRMNINASDWTTDDHGRSMTALHIAAENGNVEMVQYLIRQGMDVNVRDGRGDGLTALCAAAHAQREEVFQCLVETEGCDIDGTADEDGKSIRSIVIEYHNLAMLQCLLEHYEKAGNVERTMNECKLALHTVCTVENGSVEIAKYLVETCRVDVEATLDDNNELNDDFKATPLLQACAWGNLNIIKYLERCGAKVNVTDKDGDSVLHRSAAVLDVLQYFVETHGFDIEQQNQKGETTLHCASEHPVGFQNGTVQYLVGKCNANVNATNNNGETCLHIVSHNGCLSAAQYVLESGRVANVNAQDKNGQTPLHRACASNDDFASQHASLDDFFELARFWVDTAGVDMYVRDMDGKTALHIAVAFATEAAAAVATANTAVETAVTRRCKDEAKEAAEDAVYRWRKRYRFVWFLVKQIPAVSDCMDEKAIIAIERSDDPSVCPHSPKRQKM